MDFPFTSTFNPLSTEYELFNFSSTSSTQFQVQDDPIIPTLLQQEVGLNDLLLQIPSFTEDHSLETINTDQQLRQTSVLDYETRDINPNDKKKKQKVVHREIERQRRHEMSSLHATLRSLLPFEYSKGKRSMSDHLGEAVKYIKHLQENMQGLNDQRDALKKEVLSNPRVHDDHEVTVTPCKGGVDVIVKTSCGVDGDDVRLPLSKVLQCLIQEGLDVVSCISNKFDNTKLVYSIQAQVGDERRISVDAGKLQQKLAEI